MGNLNTISPIIARFEILWPIQKIVKLRFKKF